MTSAVALLVQVLAIWTALAHAKILALVDSESDYAGYLDTLRHHGHQLDVHTIKSEDWALHDPSSGLSQYSQLILLPSRIKSLGARLSSAKLMGFFEAGGSILAVTNERSAPESLRQFAAELDIHISPRGYKIADNFDAQFRKYGTVHADLVASALSTPLSPMSIEFQGSAAYLGNNPLAFALYQGSDTCYVYDARDQDEPSVSSDALWASGSQVVFGAALESRSSHSRFLWMGSDAEFIKKSPVAEHLSSWVLQEKNILRIDSVTHYKISDTSATEIEINPEVYKVGDTARYEITVQEWVDNNKWRGYDANDLQLEFVMLDPYYRLNLVKDTAKSSPEYSVYYTEFKVPDQHGMFTFRMEYARPGYTVLESSQVVTVRHTANDEWPRSWEITNSWVYLTSAVCTVVSFAVFVVLYIYSGSGSPSEAKTK